MSFFLRENLECDTVFQVCEGETLQEVYDNIARNYDLRGYNVTITLGGGIKTPLAITRPLVGGSTITIDGEGAQITSNGTHCICNTLAGIKVTVKNLKLGAWGGGAPLCAIYGGIIFVEEGMEYMASAAEHILACYGGHIAVRKSYKVTGGAVTHWHSYSAGYMVISEGITVTITNDLWFSSRWAGVADAALIAREITFVGTNIHGSKYLVHKNGFMGVDGCVFPGTTAGIAQTGGVVV